MGIKRSSGEVIVASDTGDVKWARTVKRVPIQDRWQASNLEWVKYFPWNLGVHDKLAEGAGDAHDVRSSPGVRLGPEDLEAVLMRQTSVPHRTHRFVKDFEAHGYTDRCPGCSSLLRQMAPQPHSDACRQRMDACVERASRKSFSQAVAEMHRGAEIFDNVRGGDSLKGAQPMEGVDVGVPDSDMSRDALLDRETRALDSGDQMELEQLALAHQEFLDSALKRARLSKGARSSRDIFNVDSSRCEIARNPVVASSPDKIVSVMTTEQFEKNICEVCD